MARNEQLIRQHKILQILERVRFGVTLTELKHDVVEELGLKSIHPRTLKRDLEALQAAGIDVRETEEPRGKVWKLGPLAKAPSNITASATELIALFVGRQLLYPLAGTPFWQGLETFWQKVQAELPSAVLHHYEEYKKTMRVHGVTAKNYENHQGILSTLHRAINEHRVVEMVYHSLENPGKRRRIEPYTVVLYNSSIYILARETDDQQLKVKNWKLDRIEKVVALDEWFRIPDDLNIDDYIGGMGVFVGNRLQDYTIWISAEAAQWVREEPWHPEQQVRELKDGSIELTVQAVNERELLPKVLSFGPNARVVAPDAAVASIQSIIKTMAASYDAAAAS